MHGEKVDQLLTESKTGLFLKFSHPFCFYTLFCHSIGGMVFTSHIFGISEDSTIFGLNEPPKVTNHTPSRETRMPLTAKNLQEKDKYGKVVVSYKRKYVHEVLVDCLVKLAQEKSVVR